MPARKVPLASRFWAKVDKSGDCWVWKGAHHKFGYGLVQVAGRSVGAHRVAYELANGPIPEGLFILHNCDNPACVRPDHLRAGTPADNMRDKVERGRGNAPRGDDTGIRRHPERYPRGEQHHSARLTRADVEAIRARYAKGGVSQYELALEYDVSQSLINRILKGLIWRH